MRSTATATILIPRSIYSAVIGVADNAENDSARHFATFGDFALLPSDNVRPTRPDVLAPHNVGISIAVHLPSERYEKLDVPAQGGDDICPFHWKTIGTEDHPFGGFSISFYDADEDSKGNREGEFTGGEF
jgi:hypothetical protein